MTAVLTRRTVLSSSIGVRNIRRFCFNSQNVYATSVANVNLAIGCVLCYFDPFLILYMEHVSWNMVQVQNVHPQLQHDDVDHFVNGSLNLWETLIKAVSNPCVMLEASKNTDVTIFPQNCHRQTHHRFVVEKMPKYYFCSKRDFFLVFIRLIS